MLKIRCVEEGLSVPVELASRTAVAALFALFIVIFLLSISISPELPETYVAFIVPLMVMTSPSTAD